MRDLGKIVGHIPARAGSVRVKSKNLRYLAGQPLLSYSVKAALGCELLDEVVVNTDGADLTALAMELGAKVFRRDAELASDTASGDAFTYDFITKWEVDTLVMISPVCPLITSADITAGLGYFSEHEGADTLITSCDTKMQTFMEGEPVNIRTDVPLAPTQINPVVQTLNWAVTIWDAAAYVANYERDGHAYLGNQRALMAISPLKGVKISNEDDFLTADALLRSRATESSSSNLSYWSEGKPLNL